ncbi:site-2 protease family protein [Haliovirga abyssi]|uniref:Site-2 protease family protein n=1 Tax=Haliovirga abyssi TaxID=2996794 RepID=A0AAU9DY01_9FUSO|nr:site-2 protease family protein [Haliovirga abyssi]BDU50285.1 site-2 protease family protein [Haliovirga abyssi]
MKSKFNEYVYKFRQMNRNISPIAKYVYGGLIILIFIALFKKVILNPGIIIMIIAMYFAIVLHEVAHGYVAFLNGDPTAKIFGRLTLNPVKHIDPIGITIPMILIFMGSPFVIGWAKPVPINYSMLKNKKIGLFTVAIAGVTVNFINVIISTLILKIFFSQQVIYSIYISLMQGMSINIFNIQNGLALFFIYFIFINMALGIFNLIPIPPLDGSRILEVFVNKKGKQLLNSMEKYGMIILVVLLYLNVIQMIIEPIFNFFLKIIFSIL